MKTFKISCRKVKICISPRGGNFQFSARGETYVYLKKISPRGEFHLACVYHACGLACSGLRFSGFRGFVPYQFCWGSGLCRYHWVFGLLVAPWGSGLWIGAACGFGGLRRFGPFQTGGVVVCVHSREPGARAPRLLRFMLLASFSDTLLVVSILDIVYDMIAICGHFCSPEGVINSSCGNYGSFLTWG